VRGEARRGTRHQPAHVSALVTAVVIAVSGEAILGQPAQPLHAGGRRSDDASVVSVTDDAARDEPSLWRLLVWTKNSTSPSATARSRSTQSRNLSCHALPGISIQIGASTLDEMRLLASS
jgi:hypothetical protein